MQYPLVLILVLSGCASPYGYPDSSGIPYRSGTPIASHIPVGTGPPASSSVQHPVSGLGRSASAYTSRPRYQKYKHTHTDHLGNKYKTKVEVFPSGRIRTKTKVKRSKESRAVERVQRWMRSR